MKKLLVSLVFIGGCFGQSFAPSYVVGSGISYDYYGKTGFALQQTFAVRLCQLTNSCVVTSANLYSYSTLTNTTTQATISTGAAYCPINSGNISGCFLGTAGLLSGSGSPILSSFSAGGTIQYDIGAKLKSSHHYYIVGGVSLLDVTSQQVKPVYGIGFAAGF